MILNIRRVFTSAGIVLMIAGPLLAQEAGTPLHFDFILEKKTSVHEGDEFPIDAVLKARLAGVQGWSYGVTHDKDVLDVLSITVAGSDLPGVMKDGTNIMEIVKQGGVNIGWFQGTILAFQETPSELPVEDRFVMAKARYKVRAGVLGARKDLSTSIAYTDKIAPVAGGNPIDVIVTYNETVTEPKGAKGIVPKVQTPAEVTVQAPTVDLKLKLENSVPGSKLVADTKATLDLNISLENDSATKADVQGWAYGLKLDPALLTVVNLSSGAAVAFLNGGKGPDFRSYSCPVDCNPPPIVDGAGGTVKGFTVGVVISIDPPNDVLSIPSTESRLLEVLKVKSAITLTPPSADRDTQLDFVSDILPGDRPVETVIAVDNQSVTPTQGPPLTVTLTAKPTTNKFKRGFSNPDAKFDIADGIWTIRVLFYQQGTFSCMDAADANDDGRVDLSDAVFTFNYLLQPGKHSGDSLYPKPPAPFPGCGDDTSEDSLSCDSPTQGCP